MFESDDFDQVLSQFEIPEVLPEEKYSQKENVTSHIKKPDNPVESNSNKLVTVNESFKPPTNNVLREQAISPKHIKRKIINSYFDHKTKRKFPGPAGILNGSMEEPEDHSIGHMELLSQDIDFSQHNLQKHIFESPLWTRLLIDVKRWNLCNIDTIKSIKQQAISGILKRRKAQTITAFVEAVDRSAIDPLIILRDASGSIKCTLHRDAWSQFSPYIVSQYCVLILSKPTILITGSAFKKHYLNITLNNIYAIYSSAVLNDDAEKKDMCEGYEVVQEEDFTVIKAINLSSTNPDLNNDLDASGNNILDGLDSIFSEDIF
ncbi:uncharacterized protein LOC115455810 [Manduca sexta]|uniref:Homologous recombination OB-fold protein OB-fold domain-containing protein n=1 Tax=Manduca sexta TaxID=7130 RepID=A0A922CEM8_MANSE|nr:uncharacterized protein LOC115455810 [Manduca sexta]KAG6443345.1 hypothetical protein O3G_MSEX002799 [Manduca sexta]KAG6443346.1 hypothetical protein O3G_MSEX002799 [Manduca sexta]KAG6443347.1 hypothetical protein O3G_MSEX002799 [Manduca sexta]